MGTEKGTEKGTERELKRERKLERERCGNERITVFKQLRS